jgi:hypothetical protein
MTIFYSEFHKIPTKNPGVKNATDVQTDKQTHMKGEGTLPTNGQDKRSETIRCPLFYRHAYI